MKKLLLFFVISITAITFGCKKSHITPPGPLTSITLVKDSLDMVARHYRTASIRPCSGRL